MTSLGGHRPRLWGDDAPGGDPRAAPGATRRGTARAKNLLGRSAGSRGVCASATTRRVSRGPHWAEPTLLDLVEYVFGWSRDAAILYSSSPVPNSWSSARPGSRPTRLLDALALEPLSSADAESLRRPRGRDRPLVRAEAANRRRKLGWGADGAAGVEPAWGIAFAFLFELPIALAYVWLATVLTTLRAVTTCSRAAYSAAASASRWSLRSSGVWILQWVALSGWLMAALGIAPTFLGLGVTTGVHAFTTSATWAASGPTASSSSSSSTPWSALVLLASGFRNYVRFQFVMWYAILISFGVVLLLFLGTNPGGRFTGKINAFAPSAWTASRTSSPRPGVRVGRRPASTSTRRSGCSGRCWWSWLCVDLLSRWASYSVEQGGEIKNAHVFRNQVFIIVGSLIATAGPADPAGGLPCSTGSEATR